MPEYEVERRETEGCPKHGKTWLCSTGKEIICNASRCEWRIKARRGIDRDIPKIGDWD